MCILLPLDHKYGIGFTMCSGFVHDDISGIIFTIITLGL
jgi:hypothetical protein